MLQGEVRMEANSTSECLGPFCCRFYGFDIALDSKIECFLVPQTGSLLYGGNPRETKVLSRQQELSSIASLPSSG